MAFEKLILCRIELIVVASIIWHLSLWLIRPARRFGDAYRARFFAEIALRYVYTIEPSAVNVLKTRRIG